MPGIYRHVLVLGLAVLLLAGCSLSPVESRLPPGYSMVSLGEVATDSMFAADPQGERVALVRDALYLLEVSSGRESKLSDRFPLDLAWSRDGDILAALFADAEQSEVVFFDQAGRRLETTTVRGRMTDLHWTPAGELLGQVLRFRSYSFGVSMKAVLLRWKNLNSFTELPLYDTTFKPGTLGGLEESFYRLSQFDPAPFGDEILYTRLYDPPVIRKSLKVFLRNLTAGSERIVYDLPLESGGSQWFHDGSSMLMSDGRVRTFLYDPRQEEVLLSWDSPGRYLALSPVDDLLYIDGVLYRLADSVLQLPVGAARFSGDGRHLLVVAGQELRLYQLPDRVEAGY